MYSKMHRMFMLFQISPYVHTFFLVHSFKVRSKILEFQDLLSKQTSSGSNDHHSDMISISDKQI